MVLDTHFTVTQYITLIYNHTFNQSDNQLINRSTVAVSTAYQNAIYTIGSYVCMCIVAVSTAYHSIISNIVYIFIYLYMYEIFLGMSDFRGRWLCAPYKV